MPLENGGWTPAAALTSYTSAEDRTEAIAAGYHMHVPKSATPGELVSVVTSLARIARAMK